MLVALLVALVSPSLACEPEQAPPSLFVDPEIDDDTPPPRPQIADVDLEWLPAEACEGCGDAILLRILFDEIDDDVTDFEDLGYRARLLEGDLPGDLTLPELPFQGPDARFVWNVDRELLRDDIILVVELRTVDEAGNESTGSQEVSIRQPGLGILACGTAPAWAWWWLVPGALFATRRRHV